MCLCPAVPLTTVHCALAACKLKHTHTGWQSWQWDSLAKMMHVVPHVGDPGSDASRVLVRVGHGDPAGGH